MGSINTVKGYIQFPIYRQIAEFDIIEREDGVTMEESAGAISAMEVFNPRKKKLW